MKKRKMLWCAVLLLATLGFVACDDDDEVKAEPTSPAVVGDYTGTMDMVFTYGSLVYEDRTMTLVADGDYAVCVKMDDADLGVANVKGVPVVRDEKGNYSLEETDGVLSMPLHSGVVGGTPTTTGEMADYSCVVSGTISSDKSDFSIVISLPGVMGGTTYTLTPASE